MNQQELKKQALEISNEQEYNIKIKKLHKKGLVMDDEILKHFDSILGKGFNPLENDIITENFKK